MFRSLAILGLIGSRGTHRVEGAVAAIAEALYLAHSPHRALLNELRKTLQRLPPRERRRYSS